MGNSLGHLGWDIFQCGAAHTRMWMDVYSLTAKQTLFLFAHINTHFPQYPFCISVSVGAKRHVFIAYITFCTALRSQLQIMQSLGTFHCSSTAMILWNRCWKEFQVKHGSCMSFTAHLLLAQFWNPGESHRLLTVLFRPTLILFQTKVRNSFFMTWTHPLFTSLWALLCLAYSNWWPLPWLVWNDELGWEMEYL